MSKNIKETTFNTLSQLRCRLALIRAQCDEYQRRAEQMIEEEQAYPGMVIQTPVWVQIMHMYAFADQASRVLGEIDRRP